MGVGWTNLSVNKTSYGNLQYSNEPIDKSRVVYISFISEFISIGVCLFMK